jgi:hypothetical protein
MLGGPVIDGHKRVAAHEQLGRSEAVQWESDGFHMDGVVTYPPGFAARGWTVFELNYRGSDNLGNPFQAGIWNDAGAGDFRVPITQSFQLYQALVDNRAAARVHRSTSSTRRFLALPSSSLFEATGANGPFP